MPVLAETAAENRQSALAVTVIVAVIFVLAVLVIWGLMAGHWFGFNTVPDVGTAPSATPPPASPSPS